MPAKLHWFWSNPLQSFGKWPLQLQNHLCCIVQVQWSSTLSARSYYEDIVRSSFADLRWQHHNRLSQNRYMGSQRLHHLHSLILGIFQRQTEGSLVWIHYLPAILG